MDHWQPNFNIDGIRNFIAQQKQRNNANNSF